MTHCLGTINDFDPTGSKVKVIANISTKLSDPQTSLAHYLFSFVICSMFFIEDYLLKCILHYGK